MVASGGKRSELAAARQRHDALAGPNRREHATTAAPSILTGVTLTRSPS